MIQKFKILYIFLFIFAFEYSSAKIIAVYPKNLTSVPKEGLEIKVTFDSPVVESEVIPGKSLLVMANYSGVLDGDLSFSSDGLTLKYAIKGHLTVGEVVSINLSKAISVANEGLRFWEFRIRTLVSDNLTWEKIKTIEVTRPEDQGKLLTYGSFAGDLNNDGWHDITVINEYGNDIRTYMNDGQGDIIETPIIVNASSNYTDAASRNEGGDFNLDGELDLAVSQYAGSAIGMFLGDGTGKLTLSGEYGVGGSAPVSTRPRGMCALDLNRDNFYDLVSANRIGNNVSILINKGDGTFSESVELEGGVNYENACASGDFNGDGLEDVVIGGFGRIDDHAEPSGVASLAVLLSDGSGSLETSPSLVMPLSTGPYMIVTGDINKDQILDITIINYTANSFSYLEGKGDGTFAAVVDYPLQLESDIQFGSGVAIDLGDVNGDDYLDVLTSNLHSTKKFTLYLGGADGTFEFSTYLGDEVFLRAASDALLHDRDNDGDLDLTGIDEGLDLIDVFENKGTPRVVTTSEFLNHSNEIFNSINIDEKSGSIIYSLAENKPAQLELYNTNGKLLFKTVLQPDVNKQVLYGKQPENIAGIIFLKAWNNENSFSTKYHQLTHFRY